MIPGRKAKHDGIESEVTVEADKVTLGGTLALPDKAVGSIVRGTAVSHKCSTQRASGLCYSTF